MPNPEMALGRVLADLLFKRSQLTDALTNRDPFAVQHGNPRGIVASIFEVLESLKQDANRCSTSNIANNSAHPYL
jgi:hypothetical protein